MDAHILPDGPDCAPRERSAVERHLPTEEEILVDYASDGTTTDRGRDSIRDTQGLDR